MKKINFKNLPDTSTPLSAENMNLLQNNMEESTVEVSPTQPANNQNIWFKKSENLFPINFDVNNKFTQTADSEDSVYILNRGSMFYLEKKQYSITFETDIGLGNSGDTVQVYMLKDDMYDYFFEVESKQYTFTPREAGYYTLRFDINQNGRTHSIWNIMLNEGQPKSYQPYIKNEIYVKNEENYIRFYPQDKTVLFAGDVGGVGSIINFKENYKNFRYLLITTRNQGVNDVHVVDVSFDSDWEVNLSDSSSSSERWQQIRFIRGELSKNTLKITKLVGMNINMDTLTFQKFDNPMGFMRVVGIR